MKKIFALFVSSLALVAAAAGSASAWCNDCCGKCCATICLRPYNAFTPVCCGSLCCDGCASMMFGGMYLPNPCGAGLPGPSGWPGLGGWAGATYPYGPVASYPMPLPNAPAAPTVVPGAPGAAPSATPPAFKAPAPTPIESTPPKGDTTSQAVPYPMAYGAVHYAGYYPGYMPAPGYGMPYYWGAPTMPAAR